jgi:hypothetical protein
MRGPQNEFELPFTEAIFGGPATRESRNYWMKREGAEDVIVPNVSRFGENNKATGEQGWEDVRAGSALEELLLLPTTEKTIPAAENRDAARHAGSTCAIGKRPGSCGPALAKITSCSSMEGF